MRAINHAMSGAIIGMTVASPILAAALAFVSHFVLDAVPHHVDNEHYPIGSKPFTTILIADALLCIALVIVLFTVLPTWMAFVATSCAFLATSPDTMWIRRFVIARRSGIDPGVKGFMQNVHAKTQWSETPQGKWVELVAGIIFGSILVKLL